MFPFYENKSKQMQIIPIKNLSFPPHLHIHLEIIYITQGEISVTVEDSTAVLKQGEACVVFPNMVHAYDFTGPGQENNGILVICPLSDVGKVEAALREKKPRCPFLNLGQIPADVHSAFPELLECSGQADPYLPQAIFQLLFLRLLPGLDLIDAPNSDVTTLTGRVVTYISGHYREPVSLSGVAASLNISPYYLSHLLAASIHMNFRQYVNALRVEYAKNLLLSGHDSILEAAMESGFDNLRTFNRAFKSITGETPKAFRGGPRLRS